MDRDDEIDAICSTIVRCFKPEKLVLFGSEARGVSRPDSDIDLLVVMHCDRSPMRHSAEIYQAIRDRKVAVDLVVRTPEDVQWRLEQGDPFIHDIFQTGRVIHEGAHA